MEQPESRKKVILIVDDIEMNREILRVSFENECEIMEAEDGHEALKLLADHTVDLLITDIIMDGLDGYELIRAVRSDPKFDSLDIVAITEHDEVLQHKVLDLGADEFICKPFVARALKSCVGNLLFGERMKTKIEQLHMVFDKNPIPFLLYHLYVDSYGRYTKYVITYANHAAENLLNISIDDMLGKTVSDPSAERMDFLIRANESEETQQSLHYDNRCQKHLNITAYRESEDYVALIIQDATMQIQAQKAIETEYTYLSELQDEKLLAKCRINVTKNLIDTYTAHESMEAPVQSQIYSEAVEKITSLCATEEMANRFHSHLMPEYILQFYDKGSRELRVDYLRWMQDGSSIWVRTIVRFYRDPDTQDIMGFVYTYNVDQEKTMQLIVDRIAETEFETLGLLYVHSNKLHCVKASELEQGLACGVDVDYLEGMREFVDRYISDELKTEVSEKMNISSIIRELQERKIYSFSYPIYYKDEVFYKNWEFSYLDEIHEIIIFTRSDITEVFREQTQQRENLRNALVLAEKASHAKTDFLSHMSHEIRTPMNAIIGMSTLAAQCVNNPDEVAECISKVGISARFLLSLINDILDMSRIESGKVTLKNEKFPFDEFVSNINTIIYNQAESKGIEYDCVITSFVNTNYVGDATKLQQILINLLGNAVKFTSQGGKVQFVVRQNSVTNKTAAMSFSVIDTGIGISEEFQKKMFEPFEQADHGTTAIYQGTGLGLAISKNLVEMMGGTISVNSIEGVGTEFIVNVPLEVSDDNSGSILPRDIPYEKLKTLIVDDDVLICENAQKTLRDMGVRAEWVSSGKQAIELVQTRKKASEYFDVILLDWKMPDMDGVETARQLRKIVGEEVTIIIITAYEWAEIEQQAKAAGVNLLITKPLFKSTLVSALQCVYSSKSKKEEIPKREYDFSGKRILLAEDHILNVEVAKRLLESKHAIIEVAENGLKAIEMFAKSQTGYYDLILMDIRMPVMDGLTSARSIRQLSNEDAVKIPIIAMSANAFDEDIEKSTAAGMNAHLSKPIEPHVLYSTLERFFETIDNKHDDFIR